MDCALLQPWITVRGGPPVTSIAQDASGYLDLGDHEDVVLYVHVTELSAQAVTMNYETSPTRRDGDFLPLVGAFTLATGVRVDRAMFSMSATPPARFVRWRLSSGGGATWDATFRVWVAAYGLRRSA